MRSWRLALLAALAILTVALLAPVAPSAGGGGGFRWDLVAHALSFSALGLLASRAFPAAPRPIAWGALALYGLATEVAQRSLPPRAFDLADLAADAVGALVVLLPRRPKGL